MNKELFKIVEITEENEHLIDKNFNAEEEIIRLLQIEFDDLVLEEFNKLSSKL